MSAKGRQFCAICLTMAMALLPVLAGYAVAASYPVSGKWTYEDVSGDGPARQCGRRFMDFQGDRRLDTGGGVPDFRNLMASRIGANEFRLVDEFNTGQIRARVDYTLRIIDNDHIELKLPQGKSVTLRRCG